jgi:hypothetical protein
MFDPEQLVPARAWLALLILPLACADAAATPEQQAPNAVQGPPLELQGPAWRPVAPRLLREPAGEAPVDVAALRRMYGPTDMRLNDCTKLGLDGTITGTGCPSGCAVFGPYAAAPAGSTVHVEFELVARDALEFSSDMITDLQLTRGQVAPQRLAAGETRRLGYDVYFPDAAKLLEARIWIGSDKPVNFEIKSLGVRVQ